MTIENLLLALVLMKYADEVGEYDVKTYTQCYDKAGIILGVKPLSEILMNNKIKSGWVKYGENK